LIVRPPNRPLFVGLGATLHSAGSGESSFVTS
jgi:hypothetical protein